MNVETYVWSPIFASALSETDSRKLPHRISEAARAMDKRLSDHQPMDLTELQAICEAKAALNLLKHRGAFRSFSLRRLLQLAN